MRPSGAVCFAADQAGKIAFWSNACAELGCVLMSLLITNQVVMDPNDTVIEPAGWRVAVASETEADMSCSSPALWRGTGRRTSEGCT